MFKDADLYEGLLVEALLVADDLQRTQLPCLMVSTLQHLHMHSQSHVHLLLKIAVTAGLRTQHHALARAQSMACRLESSLL